MSETKRSDPQPAEPHAQGRRTPTQERSRQRVERILAVASDLIAAKGSDQLRMSEVAELAKISIGSLYQYFPDKSAVIHALAERYNEASRTCIADALAGVSDLERLRAAFAGLVDTYYQIFLAEPVMRDIWSGMQADKQLAALELAEGRANAMRLAAAMQRVHPHADPVALAATALLVWHLGEATMRLAISLERQEGAALVEAYKRIMLREISLA
jgi:AcrR family transcriptional regulator